MRIGINLLYMNKTMNRGVEKHTEALLYGFQAIDLLKDCVLFVRESYYEVATTLYPDAKIEVVEPNSFSRFIIKHKKRYHNFIECLLLNRKPIEKSSLQHNIDLMFHPFNDSTIHFSPCYKNVLVIHDLYYKRYPHIYGRFHYLYAKHKHAYFLSKASTIVTVSEHIKNTLLSEFKHSQDLFFQVIPDAFLKDHRFTSFVPIDEPYILAIAPHSYEKNLITLLKAFYLIKKRIPHQLVLVGKHQEETNQLYDYVKTHDMLDRVLFLEGIPDEHRNSLYQHACLLVVPSLYESFGRVPLEAAMLKTPTIISNTAALSEVTLGLLTSYEPAFDSRALALKMLGILQNPPSIETRDEIAETYKNLYNNVTVAKRYESILLSQLS